MSRDSLVETSLAGLRPVGVHGRRTLDSWGQIVAFIEADPELGEAHARLFAEPVSDDWTSVEWYRPPRLEGAALPLEELPPPARESLKERARRLTAELHARAEVLRASPREDLSRMGELLGTALLVPEDQGVLYDIGGQPVMINWATLNDVPSPPLAVLEDYLRATPVAPEAAVEPELPMPTPVAAGPGHVLASTLVIRDPWSWWNLLWLLFALLLLLLLFLLFVACGLGLPVGGGLVDFCPRVSAVSPALAEARERGEDLRSELERLEASLQDLPHCPAPPAAESPEPPRAAELEPTPPEPPAEEPDAFDEALEDVRPADVGDILVTLLWTYRGYPDLDLKVACPDGSLIYFNRPTSCGGRLDVDANGANDRRDRPVENIYWEAESAARGEYTVFVDNYKGRGAGNAAVPFELRVKIGDNSKVYEGAVAPPGTGDFVATFIIE